MFLLEKQPHLCPPFNSLPSSAMDSSMFVLLITILVALCISIDTLYCLKMSIKNEFMKYNTLVPDVMNRFLWTWKESKWTNKLVKSSKLEISNPFVRSWIITRTWMSLLFIYWVLFREQIQWLWRKPLRERDPAPSVLTATQKASLLISHPLWLLPMRTPWCPRTTLLFLSILYLITINTTTTTLLWMPIPLLIVRMMRMTLMNLEIQISFDRRASVISSLWILKTTSLWIKQQRSLIVVVVVLLILIATKLNLFRDQIVSIVN